MDRMGRNAVLQLGAPVLILGWLILGLAQDEIMVLVARAICGAAVGLTAAPAQVQ